MLQQPWGRRRKSLITKKTPPCQWCQMFHRHNCAIEFWSIYKPMDNNKCMCASRWLPESSLGWRHYLKMRKMYSFVYSPAYCIVKTDSSQISSNVSLEEEPWVTPNDTWAPLSFFPLTTVGSRISFHPFKSCSCLVLQIPFSFSHRVITLTWTVRSPYLNS